MAGLGFSLLVFVLAAISSRQTTYAADQGQYRVGCYITYWSINSGVFPITQNNLKSCTHVFYAFVQIKNGKLVPYDDDGNFATHMSQLKDIRAQYPDMKIVASVGGGTTGGVVFLALTETQQKMDTFAADSVSFLRQYDLDGLDVDWEAGWCYHEWDTAKNAALLNALSVAFKAAGGTRPLILTAALLPILYYPTFNPDCSVKTDVNRQFYDIPSLTNSLDFANLMTYDLTGSWRAVTGFHSALYGPGNTVDPSVSEVVSFYINSGLPKEKAVMGIPIYGRSWILANTSNTAVGAPTTGAGDPETPFYSEICKNVGVDGQCGRWPKQYDDQAECPYAYKSGQWVGYEDIQSSREKANYVISEQLSGAFFWSLEMDDLNNDCGLGVSPIVNTVVSTLTGIPWTPSSPSSSSTLSSMQTTPGVPPTPFGEYRVGCYITHWSINSGVFQITGDKLKSCTHIFYAFVQIKNDQLVPYDDDGNFATHMSQLRDVRTQYPGIKILASVGGGTTGGAVFLALTDTQLKMDTFAADSACFLRQFDLDGLDVDWEAEWCYHGWDTAKNAALLNSLSVAFKAPGGPRPLVLTAALLPVLYYPTFNPDCSVETDVNRPFYDIPSLTNSLDFANLMTYDLTGSWRAVTGFHSALNGPGNAVDPSVSEVVSFFLNSGLPKEKAVMGIPIYGRSWILANTSNTAVGAPTTGSGDTVTPHYSEICNNVEVNGWTKQYDDQAECPYTYKGDQWVGYEDIQSSTEKANYVISEQLSGAFFWSLEMDDLNNACGHGVSPIVHTVVSTLNGMPPTPSSTSSSSTLSPEQTTSAGAPGVPATPKKDPPNPSSAGCVSFSSLAMYLWTYVCYLTVIYR